jgi:glycosyltransferase involved in cell wall biosynthesis
VITLPMPRSRARDAAAAVRSALTGLPFLITRDRVPAMYRIVRDLAARQPFDAIHADQLWMAPYALAAQRAGAGRPARLVLDQHNAVYLIPQRLAAHSTNRLLRAGLQHETRLMARYEAAICRRFDRVVVLTPDDRAALERLYPPGAAPHLPAIPLCVDTGAVPAWTLADQAPVVLFVGGMHWLPNADGAAWFAEAVLPQVLAAVPEATFWAVGREPPAAVRAAPATRAPGFVADVDDCWRGCRVFVVPLRSGGGMRVKILDAWSRGVPVVSTTIGAEGLSYRAGEDILIADTAADFAQAVARVLTDPALARRLSAGGRETASAHYDWRRTYTAWEAVYAA